MVDATLLAAILAITGVPLLTNILALYQMGEKEQAHAALATAARLKPEAARRRWPWARYRTRGDSRLLPSPCQLVGALAADVDRGVIGWHLLDLATEAVERGLFGHRECVFNGHFTQHFSFGVHDADWSNADLIVQTGFSSNR